MKSLQTTIVSAILLFCSLLPLPAAPVQLSSREKILEVLKQYAPDAYFILDNYEHAPRHYSYGSGWVSLGKAEDFMKYIQGDSDYELLDDLNTAVHEINHGLCALPYAFIKGQERQPGQRFNAIFLGGDSVMVVPVTETFPAKKMAQAIPPVMRTFRYPTYISSSLPNQSTQVEGIYGLLDELNSYYHGTKVIYDLYPFCRDVLQTSGKKWLKFFQAFNGTFFAYAEFKYFILQYLIYAETRERRIYDGILNNRRFCQAFCQVDRNFAVLIQNYWSLKQEINDSLVRDGHRVKENDQFITIDDEGVGNFLAEFKKLSAEMEKEPFRSMEARLRRHAGLDSTGNYSVALLFTELPSRPLPPAPKAPKDVSADAYQPPASAPVVEPDQRQASPDSHSDSPPSPEEKVTLPIDAQSEPALPPNVESPSEASIPPPSQQETTSTYPSTIAELLQRYFAESFGWYGYGVRLGLLRPASDLGSSAAAGIHFPLGRLASNTETAVVVDYWNESRYEKGFHEEWKAFGLSVILRHYLAADEFSISPYLGGGCGLNHSSKFHRSFQTDPAATRTARSPSGLSLQLEAFAGLQFPLAQKRLFFEVNFSAAKVNTLGLYTGIDFLQAAGKE